MKIAVVSTDGVHVDEHFGKAKRFFIYSVSNENIQLEEERLSESLSEGDLNHEFKPDKFYRILGIIKDCQKVFAKRVGITPASQLIANGIEPVIYAGPIVDIPAHKLF
jgi:hypothetical protein